eukprot:scaffold215628_cov17-Tisochrysis_lutea.AAC.1
MSYLNCIKAKNAQAERAAAESREAEWEREQMVRREIVKCWKERQEAARRMAAGVLVWRRKGGNGSGHALRPDMQPK